MPLPKSASSAARATEVYSETCTLVLKLLSKPPNGLDADDPLFEDVLSFLPFLRQLLTCCACAGIAEDSVTSTSCGHCYCYDCQFREPVLKIQCRQCKERRGLVCEKQLRVVVQLYKELVTLLSIHFKDVSTVREPLNELIQEVISNQKVSRSVLMLPPPLQYQSIPKQITITPKKSPQKKALGGLKSSGLKRAKKKLLVGKERSVTGENVALPSGLPPRGVAKVPHTEPGLKSNEIKVSEPSSKSIVADNTDVASTPSSSCIIDTVSTDKTTVKHPGTSSRKRAFLVKVAGTSNRHKAMYPCRCGTNAGVTLGNRICARRKCSCYVNKVSCKYCKCKGCRNPFNGNLKKKVIQ